MGWITSSAADRQTAGLRRQLRTRQPHSRILDLASNDYLGLATDRRVIDAARQATTTWGAGATGSRLVTGTTALHTELEQSLAAFTGSPAAVVFSSGYLANIGAITALSDADTVLVCDRLNHASLIDAARISRARIHITEHRDVAAVANALATRREPKAIIVTDAIFSVDGDIAPLAELSDVALRYGAILVVDEAHSLGVVGQRGAGACQAVGISGLPHVVATVTLSKSLGSQGGAVIGSEAVIDHVINTARTFIFDTGLAPGSTGAALAALGVIEAEPQRVQAAQSNARLLQQSARDLALGSADSDGAVISVLLGDPTEALAATAVCLERGVSVGCFRPPSVPDGISRLRITARATLSSADLDLAREALAAVADSVGTAALGATSTNSTSTIREHV
ncbi:MAG: 8-amino-7-oxononanoate synthase [Actinobacteria bacterium]|nr:8-amino-7-oxononanoate synthase [Actinomycetota bacterium]